MKIEVKASEREECIFFLTRNEWETAIKNENYIFHFWNLVKNELLVFNLEQIQVYIPLDDIKSKWRECEIKLSKDDINRFRVFY